MLPTYLQSMLFEVSQFRQKNGQEFAPEAQVSEPEHLPWTASEGPGGMRGLLSRQHAMTVENALPEAQDSHQRQLLIEQLLQLTDAILDGFRIQLDSVKQSGGQNVRYMELVRQYEGQRSLLLAPFLEMKQHERAASLAEKYCDFATLVQLCEETDDQQRLSRYMEQFGNRVSALHLNCISISDFTCRVSLISSLNGTWMKENVVNCSAATGCLRCRSWAAFCRLMSTNT